MKILFVSDVSISSLIGGAERVLYEQSTRLSQNHHFIHLLTRKITGHEKDHDTINGVTEWRYECQQENSVSFLKETLINSKRLFERLHEKYSFDCINFHQPFSALGIINSQLSANLPKIYTCHSLSFEEFSSRNRGAKGLLEKPLNFFQIYGRKWIEKNVLKKSDKIIALSNFTKTKLRNSYNIEPGNISIIPGGVDFKKFHPAEDKLEVRKALNIPCDKIVLFTVRNLVSRMGIENLINAFKIAVKEVPDLFLAVGGEGPLENHLIKLAKSVGLKEVINFIGFIPEEQLADYYRMADIFVLPTKELEGFGLVTLEAMASGLPVLGTPVGGTKEILGKFDSSFLFDGTNSGSMAALILEKYHLIKNNAQKWEDISHQCRNFVMSNYSWEQNIDSLEKLFEKTSHN